MAAVKLAADARTEFGKGVSRRLRVAGKTPAVLYGHGTAPVHIALPGHALMMALKNPNVLLEIEMDGTSELAIAKDVQRNPVRHHIEHVDLIIVKRGEKITVSVPVTVVGESAPGTIHIVESQNLDVEAEATNLPSELRVDIEGLEAGQHVTAGDVELPEGSTLITDPESVVVVVTVPQVEEEPEVAETDEELEEGAEPAAEAEEAADAEESE